MEVQGKKVLVTGADSFRCGFALYCVGVTATFMVWVVGSTGLGPLDDHLFIGTIFQGKEFGAYVNPETGRFYPLTAQKYVVAAKLFEPSAQMFYLINAFKLVLCGGLLFFCLALDRIGQFRIGHPLDDRHVFHGDRKHLAPAECRLIQRAYFDVAVRMVRPDAAISA